MKIQYILIMILSPILLLSLVMFVPLYFLHRLVDERSYNIKK